VRNPAAEQLAQIPEFAGGFPAAIAEPLARVLATGEHYAPTDYGRVVILRVNAEDRHYLPRVLAIGDKLTEFKGAAVILQDVTKFRLLDDAKTNLVGTVSHELKTPLTSLRMALYLLLEQNLTALSPQQRELLEDARNDADRLLRILDTLLDLTRLESGAAPLERADVGVAALLHRVAGEAHPFIDAAGQRLAVVIGPDLSGTTLNVDEARLRHVFMNLLTNASKYTGRDGIITLAAASEGSGFVRFSVRDQGPGIPAEMSAGCSSASIACPTRRPSRARASAWPSPARSSWPTAGQLPATAARVKAPNFTFCCPVRHAAPESGSVSLIRRTLRPVFNVYPILPS
jgi:NtrC-family two-component system sensor histidine kinase KinB